MGFTAAFGGVLWGTAILGIVAAGACYWVIPWERFVDEAFAPDGVDVVWYTRVGMTAAATSLVPFAAGAWLAYVGVVGGLTSQATAGAEGPRFPLQGVAAVVPGDLLAVGSLVGGVLAALLPVWAVLWVRVRRALDGDGDPE